MNNQRLDQTLDTLSKNNAIDKQMPQSITQNLSPKYPLREYQIEAFARFIHYQKNGVNGNPAPKPLHLFFNMATGCGKTLIMAGLILYLYEQGYRNFLFFVNADNIIEKTKDNFLNETSKKYLFNEIIYLNGEQVSIDKVENFEGVNPDNISICFTTIQKLHSDLNTERENGLTIDDFARKKIVLLSDEAHHTNVSTREQMDLPLEEQDPSWENTVEKIFVANDQNLLLDFSATFEENNQAIVEKFRDKILYKYDLVKFRNDKYSKDISIVRSDFKGTDRMLQALILHYYKQSVSEINDIQLKPVILFKSKKISESKQNKAEFHELIDNLTGPRVDEIRQSEVPIIKRAFRYFADQQISSDEIARFLRENFQEKYCLAVNSKEERIDYQLEVNRLEDNLIRAIFAVQMLSEGWDVLNLFDIVRCYDSGSTKKTTTAEAQLIGRGARYFPFTLQGNDDKYKRKFDKDMKNDLRVIEELHYHSMNDSPYINEIKDVLVERGLMDEKVVRKNVKRKKAFRKSKLYRQGFIWLNDKVEKDMQEVNSFDDLTTLSVKQKFHEHTLSAGSGAATRILDNSDTDEPPELDTKDVPLTEIEHNIIQAAIARNPFFRFDKLTTRFFPNLCTMEMFRSSPNYLGGLTIKFRGQSDQLYHLDDYPHEKLKACCDLLQKVETELNENFTEHEGTTVFQKFPIQDKFDDKILKFNKGNNRINKQSLRFNRQFVKKRDWIAYNGLYGTSEERDLVKLIDELIRHLPDSYDEVFLVRNERHFKIFNFADGRAFEPDFVLFLLQKNGETITYQLFIEPKGEFLEKRDEWKETFLKEIQEKGISHILVGNHKYLILAVGQFYSEQIRDQFKEKLNKILQLAMKNEEV